MKIVILPKTNKDNIEDAPYTSQAVLIPFSIRLTPINKPDIKNMVIFIEGT